MIKTINSIPVNYNSDRFEKKEKFNLRKIKAPLVVIGMIFTLAATSIAIKHYNEPVPYEELCQIVATLPEEQRQELNDYLTAYQIYDSLDKDADIHTKIAARQELVKETQKVEHYLKNIVKDKIEEATLSDSPSYFSQYNNVSFHERDNERVTVIESFNDKQIISNSKLPKEMEKIVDDFYTHENYKGDGSNDNWASEINTYNKNTVDMIKQASIIVQKDYDYDGWTWTSNELGNQK